jgi:hypothetical protein
MPNTDEPVLEKRLSNLAFGQKATKDVNGKASKKGKKSRSD